jgi:hypothetical protein
MSWLGRHRPCPTLGDPAFHPIDLLFWQAGDGDTISHRADCWLLPSVPTPLAYSTGVLPSPPWPLQI